MNINFPEDYAIPSGKTYDRRIEELDDEIVESGGARAYAVNRRAERAKVYGFQMNLHYRSMQLIGLAHRDASGRVSESGTLFSSIALAGTIFGDAIAEPLFPGSVFVPPYKDVNVFEFCMQPDILATYLTLKPGTMERYRFGVRAMTTYVLQSLSHESLGTLGNWAYAATRYPGMQAIHPQTQGAFLMGAGLSLFQTWDHYSNYSLNQEKDSESDEVNSDLPVVEPPLI